MSADNEKVIIRRENLPGVDKSIFDHSYAFSTPIVNTKVSIDAFKVGRTGYVGIKENLNVGDIIKPVNTDTTYKVMRILRVTEKGNIYKIGRTDGYPLVAIDLDNLVEGRKVKIKNRAGVRERFNERVEAWRV